MPRFDHVTMPEFPTPYLNDVSELVAHLRNEFTGIGNYEQDSEHAHVRSHDIFLALELTSLSYLGATVPAVGDICGSGVDCAIQFFLTDWWKRSGDINPTEMWFDPFSRGLLLALVAVRFEDVKRLSNWVSIDLVADFVQFDPSRNGEIADVYKLIAACWSNRIGNDGFTQIQEKLQESKDAYISTLVSALAGIAKKDQSLFSRSIESALAMKARERFDAQDGRIADRLGLHESAIVLSGKSYGLKLPTLKTDLESLLLLDVE